MDIYEAIEKRFSVRSYEDQTVDEDRLARVLAAAQSAPTARNRQEFKLVVVRDPARREALAAASEQPFLAEAPVVLALVGLTPERKMFCNIPADPVDGAIVLDHVSLAATAEGLGTCWIGHFDQDRCREILAVPDTAHIIELMCLGRPAVSPPQRKRKPLDELVCHEQFA